MMEAERQLYDDVEALLKILTYKPGWSFDLGWHDARGYIREPVLTITVLVPDVNDPSREIRIAQRVIVPLSFAYMIQGDPPFLVRWLRDCIRDVEFHEMNEWFRLDGVAPFDPHAKKEGFPSAIP